MLGNNMFAYCLNNPVVLVDTSGNAAHIGFSADGQQNYAPWKTYSTGGGGWPADIHFDKQDYGSVADKFYTVRALRFVGTQIAHSAHKLWDAYVYSVERSSDLCLQRNMAMLRFIQDLFSSPWRVFEFSETIADGISGSIGLASVLIATECTNPIFVVGVAVLNLGRALLHIFEYFYETYLS